MNAPFSADNDSEQENDARAPRVIQSSELLQGERQIVIRHGSESYRLILTRNGRLILQK